MSYKPKNCLKGKKLYKPRFPRPIWSQAMATASAYNDILKEIQLQASIALTLSVGKYFKPENLAIELMDIIHDCEALVGSLCENYSLEANEIHEQVIIRHELKGDYPLTERR